MSIQHLLAFSLSVACCSDVFPHPLALPVIFSLLTPSLRLLFSCPVQWPDRGAGVVAALHRLGGAAAHLGQVLQPRISPLSHMGTQALPPSLGHTPASTEYTPGEREDWA